MVCSLTLYSPACPFCGKTRKLIPTWAAHWGGLHAPPPPPHHSPGLLEAQHLHPCRACGINDLPHFCMDGLQKGGAARGKDASQLSSWEQSSPGSFISHLQGLLRTSPPEEWPSLPPVPLLPWVWRCAGAITTERCSKPAPHGPSSRSPPPPAPPAPAPGRALRWAARCRAAQARCAPRAAGAAAPEPRGTQSCGARTTPVRAWPINGGWWLPAVRQWWPHRQNVGHAVRWCSARAGRAAPAPWIPAVPVVGGSTWNSVARATGARGLLVPG